MTGNRGRKIKANKAVKSRFFVLDPGIVQEPMKEYEEWYHMVYTAREADDFGCRILNGNECVTMEG